MNSASSSRFDGIDVLRGISIVAVVIHHINIHMGANHSALAQVLPRQAAATLFWNGANGVTVFFAISGFLITTMALRRWSALGQIRIADFYRLRFARIGPLLAVLLVVLSVLHLAHASWFVINPERSTLPRAFLAAATFHINWLEAQHGYLPGGWDVLWSLSVEEVFYLFFPLVCWLTRGRWTLILVLMGFVAIGPFARTLTQNEMWADHGYLSCMDAIALGCLAAMIAARFPLRPKTRIILQISGAALVLLIMTARPVVRAMHIYQVGLDVTILALGTCLLQIAIVQRSRTGRWIAAPLRWFGRNSYEVYLTHMFVVAWGIQIFQAAQPGFLWHPVAYLTMLILAGLLGAVVAKFYSEPLNQRLRSKWQPTRVTAAKAEAATS